jgi:hypothetical protein
MRLHAQEVVAVALLQERHALGHLGVADDDSGFRLAKIARGIEGCDESVDVVAVDALDVPAERLERDRFVRPPRS